MLWFMQFKNSLFFSGFEEKDNFFNDPVYQNPRYSEPKKKRPRYYEPTYRDQTRTAYDESEPKSFFNFSQDLLPDLEGVARPEGWNVHDFATWEERAENFEASKITEQHVTNFEALITKGWLRHFLFSPFLFHFWILKQKI